MQNEIKFKIGDIVTKTTGCEPSLVKSVQELSNILKELKYFGTLRKKNSKQLDIHLDKALFDALEKNKWLPEETPLVDMSSLKEKWGSPRADFIVRPPNIGEYRVVLEIEKANKKTLWFDFIKQWIFIEAKQAEVGILICPQNYSHAHGVWDLFDEACRYKRYLKRFAKVAEEKLKLIGIIGYQQMVYNGIEYKVWNKEEVKRVKKII